MLILPDPFAQTDFRLFCLCCDLPSCTESPHLQSIVQQLFSRGVAARVAYHRVGEFVEIGDLTAERLVQLIQRVRQNPSYRDKARYFQKVIAQTQGLDLAADVIERAFKKNRILDSAR